jgi:hypothetical protein
MYIQNTMAGLKEVKFREASLYSIWTKLFVSTHPLASNSHVIFNISEAI